jgi:hypothetical protein
MLAMMNPYLLSMILLFLMSTLVVNMFGIDTVVTSSQVAFGYENVHIQPVQAYCVRCY